MAREMLNMETFGGNSGQQGIFDRKDKVKTSQALQRLQALTEQYGETLDPNYSDAAAPINGIVDPTWWFNKSGQDFYDRANAQTEAQNIGRSLGGKAPMSIRQLMGDSVEGLHEGVSPLANPHAPLQRPGPQPGQNLQSWEQAQRELLDDDDTKNARNTERMRRLGYGS